MNIGIGYDAMNGAATTGDNNIAIGVSAGDALTSGNRNIYMGENACGALNNASKWIRPTPRPFNMHFG